MNKNINLTYKIILNRENKIYKNFSKNYMIKIKQLFLKTINLIYKS